MPRPLRDRLLPVLAVAGIGAATLVPGTAFAATPTVTFHGGCGLLGVGASSRPDTGAVTVAPGGTVTFVNRLERSADLMVNGATRATVPADGQIGVVFRQGRASVSLVPACLLGTGGAGSVTVLVSMPGTPSTSGTGRPTSQGSRSTEAGTAAPGARPSAVTVLPDPPAAVPAPEVSEDGTPASPDALPSSDNVAIGPVSAGPPVRKGPSLILVLLAAICVVGVSVATVRTIIAQRAIRAFAA